MTDAERQRALDALMRDRGMTARQVGVLVGAEPKTVRNWRSSTKRTIPLRAWEVLRLKLGVAA